MGNPIFRFTLTHEQAGSLEISEPDGWIDAKLKLERHEDFHSLVEYFEGAFIFYGTNGVDNGGIDFIRAIEQTYGVDATIEIDIEVSFDSAVTFEDIFHGQLDLTTLNELKDNRAQIAIIRDDFWAKFISRKETPVNLKATIDLDDESITPIGEINMNLPGQVIQQKNISRVEESVFYGTSAGGALSTDYLIIDWNQITLDEIATTYHYPVVISPTIPFEKFNLDYDGVYTFNITVYFTNAAFIIGGLGERTFTGYIDMSTPVPQLDVLFLVNGVAVGDVFTQTDLSSGGSGYSRYTFNATLNLKAGDTITIAGDVLVGTVFFPILLGTNFEAAREGVEEVDNQGTVIPSFPSGLVDDNGVSAIAQTIFPESRNKGFLLHDAAASILQSYGLDVDNPFYSEYLGGQLTNARIYPSDGCAWHYALIQGLQLRGYLLEDKSFSISFDHWWKGANPILNLGLGYDESATTPDQSLIRVEKKNWFYERSMSVGFDYVFEISREYDEERIFNKVEIGYANWQSEDISGIDDAQTKHTYATRFKKIGKGIQLHSEFIAASLAIEVTRRQTIEKSKDYKFDNNTFIISINPDDVSPDAYMPELDENFSSITNLLNSDTRYNSRLTPSRNFKRWINYFNGALQSYQSSNYKFVHGEGNYDMVSNLVTSCDVGGSLSENQNINVSTDYLHLPLLYTIEINLAWDDYVAIRNARHKAIGISQTEANHAMFFIKSLEYELVKGKATIKAWPLSYFAISQTDFTPMMRQCVAADGTCGTGALDRITSDGEGRITSDGECRIIA